MKSRFVWVSSYRQEIDYAVVDDTGSYEVRLRRGADPYEKAGYNGSRAEYENDIVASVGLLHRACFSNRPLAKATVDAFNAWRLAEHRRILAKMDAAPEIYGSRETWGSWELWLKDPEPVRAGHYETGRGWVVDYIEDRTAA